MPPFAAPGPSGDLLLKVTPPRVPRELVLRSRLMAGDPRLRECPVLLLQAPAGFGKTSLLAQWRREYLGNGDVVAWLSAQQRDDPSRLIQSLALAVRMGAARPTFGHTLLDSVTTPDGLEGITAWLAELAQSALSLVLIVDEADRLPPASREALAYLLRNAPPNLRAVVAARADCDLGFGDLIAYGQCLVLGQAALRFTLEETLSLVQARLGARADPDTAARLHELAEGWPLGLQLALSAVSASADPQAEVLTMTAPRGGLREHFVALMLANLEAHDLAFLTRVALLDNLHPELCRLLTGDDDASQRLERISRETPVFVAAEHGDWLRMHTLARDALRQRAEMLPLAERNSLHARASSWLAERGLLEEAAGHALLAGEHDRAYDLAERSLYESIMVRGRQGAVLEWLTRLPESELDRRPRLLLAAAWSLALSERHEEAGRLVARILAGPEVDAALRCECALILGGAAVFADQPDRFADLHDPWAESPPLRDPLLLFVHANRTAFRTLLEGDPALARLRQQQAPRGDFGRALEYVDRWGEFIVGLSYVWEGQVLLAESLLRPTLARVDADLGRRSAFSCMLAALLAAAVWELDRPADAAALLANRLDVLERNGLPETVLLAYRTLARAAMAEGAEHRALELLAGMHAVGVARGLPRLCLASLGDQVRLHARRYRADSCRRSCEQIDALMADPSTPRGRLWRRNADLLVNLAHGYAAIAAKDWRRAIEPLARAEALVLQLGQGRLHIEILGLRAFALDRCGERSQALLREAVDLADTYGLRRVFADAHPDLGQWVLDAAPAGAGRPATAVVPARPEAERDTGRSRSTPSMALTPKEREVLELLARSLSNKEIGRAMQVGEETIKWHMKNLFAKLDAGTRKQVVQRARILGLLRDEG